MLQCVAVCCSVLQCAAVRCGVISCDFDNAIDDNTEIGDHVESGKDMALCKFLGGYLSRCAPISTSHVSNILHDHVESGVDMALWKLSKRSKILGRYLSRCAPISTSHVSNTLHDHVEIGNDDCDAAHCNYP